MLMRTPPKEIPERPRRGQRDADLYGVVAIVALIAFAVLIAIAAIDLAPGHVPVAGDGSPSVLQSAD